MDANFYQLSGVVERIILDEKPRSVLEISGGSPKYGRLMADCMQRCRQNSKSSKQRVCIDRIDLIGMPENQQADIYNNVYSYDTLYDNGKIREYDLIIIMHLFENLEASDAKGLLESLLHKVKREIVVITPEYPYDLNFEDRISQVRTYHPVFFRGLDFSYQMVNAINEKWQIYSFFPITKYSSLPVDHLPGVVDKKKLLRLAYILPHHNLTGGMKALLQQMKELTHIGHVVTAYYRADGCTRAIPSWSHLRDDDIDGQVVVPKEKSYLSYVNEDTDVIIVGWMQQLPEFKNSDIPVVLWEQGSEYIYGDYGKLLTSNSQERLNMHNLYRIPVHLLSVSTTIQEILKGVYHRESQFFPNGIDTDFYYPLEDKHNDIPVILLVGNPSLSFKGFDFALKVLSALYATGQEFEVRWASQVDFTVSSTFPFVIKKFISLPQEKLAELYRSSDIFLSTSLYESFPLPPLEAMASGVAVVSTDNGGINIYAAPGENCLLSEQGDLTSTVAAILYLLKHPEQRVRLGNAGRETALHYSFDKVTLILEECLYKITERTI